MRMRRTQTPSASRMSARVGAVRPLDGYVRVSQVNGRSGESFISPDLQEERIRAYARSRGFEIGIVHRELDRSGTDPSRPLLQEALERAIHGASGGLAVARLDRLARSALDALNAIRQIEQGGGIFVSVEDGFDSSTPFGRAMMTILLALAELELARVREVWNAAQGKAVARGIHTASVVPFGYRRLERGQLEPDEEAAALVVDAFQRRAAGATYAEISRVLSKHGLNGGRSILTRHGAKNMIANRVYTGEAYYGQYRNPAAHPAIVPLRLWMSAQLTAEARISHPAAETLLSGLIRCAACSRIMTSRWLATDRRQGRESRLTAYSCRPGRKVHRCPLPARAPAQWIEALVVEHFFAVLRSRGSHPKEALDRLEKDAEAAQERLASLLTDESVYGAADRGDAILVAEADADAKSRRLLLGLRRTSFYELAAAGALKKAWPGMSIAARRRALGSAFDAIMIERGPRTVLADRVHFIRAGEMPDDFPSQGRPTKVRPWIPPS